MGVINRVNSTVDNNTNLLFKPEILKIFFNESSKLNSNMENILVINCDFSKIEPPKRKFKVVGLMVLSMIRMKQISQKNKDKKAALFEVLDAKDIKFSFEK